MKKHFPILITGIYFLLVFFGIRHHEMWLDEAQHILLARDSHSFSELLYNARYEGHPLLWNILLYGMAQFTDQLFFVQLLHIFISSCCVFLILKYSPFSLLVSVLICFGYFMLYEYAVISRNYSLSLFFLLLAVIQLSLEKCNYTWFFIILALLFNTHLFSMFIGTLLLVIAWKGFRLQPVRTKILSLLIFGAALLFCMLHLIPPPDHFMHGYNTDKLLSWGRFYKTLDSVVYGFLPLPDLSLSNYWSNHFLLDHYPVFSHLLSFFLLCFPAYVFRRHRTSFFIFYVAALLMGVFIWLSPLRVATRHCGFLSMLLFISAWLAKTLPQKPLVQGVPSENSGRIFSKTFFGILLVSQFISGALFFYLDIKHNFSSAEKAGTFLDSSVKENTCIALSHFTAGPALALHTRHSLFYIEPNAYGSFCKWNTNPILINDSVFLSRVHVLLRQKKEIVLINNQENKMDTLLQKNKTLGLIHDLTVKKLNTFNNGTIRSESYFVYLLTLN